VPRTCRHLPKEKARGASSGQLLMVGFEFES